MDVNYFFDKKKVLIVGGAGFIGSNLAKIFLEETKNIELIIIDNLLSSEIENLPNDKRLTFIEASITNNKVLYSLDDTYDYIFHLATYHGNQSSIYNPLADHENNTLTSLKLMNHVKDFKNLRKFVYASAGCSVAKKTYEHVEATAEDAPITLQQDSPYSISKIIGEFYSVYFHKQHKLPAVRARFQNVFGPGEVLGAGKWRGTPATVWRNVIPTFIYKSLNKQSLPLHNRGEATRDFIFVEDICRGLLLCAVNGKPGDVYNLASGQELSIKDLALTINKLTQNPVPVKLLPKRSWDTSGKRFGNPEKSKKELGFICDTSIIEGLEKTILWFKENLTLIEKQIAKHQQDLNKFKDNSNH